MMGNVYLLDCTLRDGGYINGWEFGAISIKAIIKKLEQAGVEMIEVGFLKGNDYNPNKSLFPDVQTIKSVLSHKREGTLYVGMLDMSSPIPLERIISNDGSSVDGIRVIFKKDKTIEAYKACEHIKCAGYKVFVNFVGTDAYTDKEFIEGIERFNELHPDGVAIVDTFGRIKRKHFKRLVAIADNNLNEDTMLCYHGHNNLQQAFGNAETLVEMNLKRDICIDACVFGMGRGAGNLNLELFAEYMNDNYGKHYKISHMLEVMDEHLSEFYKTKFWGYSLPLYLSAVHGCHPDYAIYLAEKNTLSEKAFNELLQGISDEDKRIFKKERAEYYYRKFMNIYVEDSHVIDALSRKFLGKKLLVLLPGKNLDKYRTEIVERYSLDAIIISVNFYDSEFHPDFVFVSNNRRFVQISEEAEAKIIATSNVQECSKADYIINFVSYISEYSQIYDNSGLMALRFLMNLGVKEVFIAGMDGYSSTESDDYYKEGFAVYRSNVALNKNELISDELKEITKHMIIHFVTPSNYKIF